MADDDLARRVAQRAQAAQELQRASNLAELREWRDAVSRFLAELRRDLPAIAEKLESTLEPINIIRTEETGKGRKKRQVRISEPSAGWQIRQWSGYGGGLSDSPHTVADYLLYDGRLLRGSSGSGTILPEHRIWEYLRMPGSILIGPPKDQFAFKELITRLYTGSGLTMPQFPEEPPYDRFKLWDDVFNGRL